ncbi:RNA polymerase sigma factor [bacterium]|nr:MAG: RNA polymerase sigma factor [bacterium]
MEETEFKLFYETHAKPLWSYVYRLTKDEALTDDIIQESFIRFLNRELSFLTESQKKSYVYQTATNIFKDHWRKNKRMISWEDTGDTLESETVNTADKVDFERAFDQLPPQYQSLLWLAYAEDYRHEEIADILKIKTHSVKVLLFRAKKRMSDIMKEFGITGGI